MRPVCLAPGRSGAKYRRPVNMRLLAILFTLLSMLLPGMAAAADAHELQKPVFLEEMAAFPQEEASAGIEGIGAKLSYRAKQQPFLLVATVIFVLAILHTFVAVPITKRAHQVQHDHDARIRKETRNAQAHH